MAAAAGLALAAGLAVSALPATASTAARSSTPEQHIGIPAYWSPNTLNGMGMFDRLSQNVPTMGITIINGPTSSAPVPLNQATATAIARLHKAGVKVLGYVDTGYLGRYGSTTTRINAGSTSVEDWQQQMRKDADDWNRLYRSYGLDGIFFDETLSSCGTDNAYLNDYKNVTDYVRSRYRGSYITINPGTSSDECYMQIADTVMIFENTYSVYQSWTPPDYVSKYPANRFWDLVYNVPTQAEMEDAVSLSKRNNAGYVYVTDRTADATHFPWDMITTSNAYWNDELLKVNGNTDITPPSPPSRVRATAAGCSSSSCTVTLAWNSATDDVAVVGYDVYRDSTFLQTVYGNSATVTGWLEPGTRYRFTVKARDESANVGAGRHVDITTPGSGRNR